MFAPRDCNVLLIDDDPTFYEDVVSVLSGLCRVEWIPGSAGALEKIQACRPVRVLLDLNMPHRLAGTDEDEGLEILERMPDDVRETVIVVTRSLSPVVRGRLDRLGVWRVFLKTDSVLRLRAMVAGGAAGGRP